MVQSGGNFSPAKLMPSWVAKASVWWEHKARRLKKNNDVFQKSMSAFALAKEGSINSPEKESLLKRRRNTFADTLLANKTVRSQANLFASIQYLQILETHHQP